MAIRVVSRTQVNRSGAMLREWWDEGLISSDDPELGRRRDAAFEVVWDHRASFREPLRRATMGLRSMVSRESPGGSVGQRLKRLEMIVNKLSRHPRMELARMQDVAGCRAILPGGRREVLGVLRRIERRWDVVDIRDLETVPRATGYRAVHVIVKRMNRLVEVQLRTPSQHEWAVAVERASARHPDLRDLKDGRGPQGVLAYFERVATAMALEEAGEMPPRELLREIGRLRLLTTAFFGELGGR